MDYSYFNQGFEAPAYGLPGMEPSLPNCSLPTAYGDLQRTPPGQVGASQHYMYNSMRPFTSTPSLPSSSCTMGMMARPADPRQTHMFPSSKSDTLFRLSFFIVRIQKPYVQLKLEFKHLSLFVAIESSQ